MLVSGFDSVVSLYVSPTGTDVGNCRSNRAKCKTWQYAVDHAPIATVTRIHVDDGVYNENVSVQHYRDVIIIGNVAIPANVVLTIPGGCGVYAEDSAIAQIRGVTFMAGAAGSTAFCGRQHVILDSANNRYGGGSVALVGIYSAYDYAIANFTGDQYLDGSTLSTAFTNDNSTLNLAATFHVKCGITLPIFLTGTERSVTKAGPASFSYFGACGPKDIHGKPYNLDNSQLMLSSVTLPGDQDPTAANHSVVE